jgi:hypothetical protein
MEKVTVKTKNPHYNGYIRGFRFVNGEAKDVPREDAEFMVEQFGVEIVEPEKPKVEAEEEKPKRSPRKK